MAGAAGYEDIDEKASKAAAILLALGGSIGSQILKDFEPSEIRKFAQMASSLDEIDPAYLINLVDEFSFEMNKSEPLRGGDQQVRSFLSEALPADQVKKILGAEDIAFVTIWQNFTAGAENTLVPYLLDEHPQTIAFILTKLDADLSAKIVAMLPREVRDSVTRRLLKMQSVEYEPNKAVQVCLQIDVLAQANKGLEEEGRARMATLLRKMDKDQVEAILGGLRAVWPGEAAALKKLLFLFEDIQKLDKKYRLILFDKVQTDQVLLAVRGVDAEMKEIILSSLGARARRMIEAELNGASNDVTPPVLDARRAIAETALRLVLSGDISLDEPAADEAGKDTDGTGTDAATDAAKTASKDAA